MSWSLDRRDAYGVSSAIRHGGQELQKPGVKVFLSPAEVAAELRVSNSTVLRLIRSGKLPAIAVSERIYRIPAATLQRFLDGTLRTPGGMAPIRRVSGPAPRFGEGERLPVRKTSVTGQVL